VDLTKFSEGAGARALVGVLNDLSTRFDSLADGRLDRDRITGDAYLACVGLSDAVTDRTIRAANKLMDLTEAMDRFNARSRYKLKVSIGIDPLRREVGSDSA